MASTGDGTYLELSSGLLFCFFFFAVVIIVIYLCNILSCEQAILVSIYGGRCEVSF